MGERLWLSGRNGPTKTITKRTASSKPHLTKDRVDASGPISMNKSVYFFVFLGDPAKHENRVTFSYVAVLSLAERPATAEKVTR